MRSPVQTFFNHDFHTFNLSCNCGFLLKKQSEKFERVFFFFFIKETFMHIWSKRKEEGPCAATYLRERLLSLANDQGPNLDAFASRKRQVFLFRERSFLLYLDSLFSRFQTLQVKSSWRQRTRVSYPTVATVLRSVNMRTIKCLN